MQLYFLRHGRSVGRSAWNGPDAERPLTEEGRGALAHEAATLVRLGLKPDVIVSSPLARARETAEILASGLGAGDSIVVDDRVAEGFGVKRLGKVLRDHADAKRVMLVGHEPDLSTIIRKLTGGRVVCSKGSLARVDVAAADTDRGELVWLLQAEVLTAQAMAPSVTSGQATRPKDEDVHDEGRDQPTAVAPTGEHVPLLDGSAASRERQPEGGAHEHEGSAGEGEAA